MNWLMRSTEAAMSRRGPRPWACCCAESRSKLDLTLRARAASWVSRWRSSFSFAAFAAPAAGALDSELDCCAAAEACADCEPLLDSTLAEDLGARASCRTVFTAADGVGAACWLAPALSPGVAVGCAVSDCWAGWSWAGWAPPAAPGCSELG